MESNYDGPLHPQLEEGITQAVWLNKDGATEALKTSYSNIKELFPDQKLNFKRRNI